MKRLSQLVLIFAALVWCVPARSQAITDTVQQANFANSANGTAPVTLTHSTAAGDLIVAAGCVINGWNAAPVTDSAAQSYTLQFTANVVQGGSTTVCNVYYKANSASGVTSVTGKQSASSGHGTLWVLHATGMDTATPIDTSATFNAGSTTPWSSTAINTTNANDLLFGLMVAQFGSGATCTPAVSGSWSLGGSVSSGAGWDGSNGNAGASGTQIVASTGSKQFTGTDGNATCTGKSSIVAFKGAAADGATVGVDKRRRYEQADE